MAETACDHGWHLVSDFLENMNLKFIMSRAIVGIFVVLLSGCLTRRTVTQGGQTVESNYVFTRPLKNAVENSR